MTDKRFYIITSLMRDLVVGHAIYWCEREACACLGCANKSGRMAGKGVTKEEWQEWWRRTVAELQAR